MPNGEIRVASNLTRVWARINQDVTVAYGTDIDKAIAWSTRSAPRWPAIPRGSGASWRRPGSSGSRRSAEYGVTLKILGTVRAADQWAAGGDFRKRLLARVQGERDRDPAAAARGPGARPERRRAGRRAGARPGRAGRGNRVASDRAPRSRIGSWSRAPGSAVGWPGQPTSHARVPLSVEPSTPSPEIENLLAESRTFPPDPAFAAQANAKAELYDEAERDFEAFWAKIARETVDWVEPFETTLEWDLPFAKWFVGGKLNMSYNCVDRHVERGLGDKVAYHWVGEPGDTRTITYADLLREVQKAANALLELGLKTGDKAAIYMPMIPELPIAMLACARLGIAHTVVFAGFSAEALVRSDQRRRGEARDHRRWFVPARQGDAAQGRGRRGGRRLPDHRARPDGPTAGRRRPRDDRPGRSRRLVARHRRPAGRRLPARAGRLRAPALPALHVGHDRQAQGDHPHDRRLPRRHVVQPPDDLRPQAGRRVLVRGRRRLGDRPQLHRVRPAGERHDRHPVRGLARHAGLGPLVADHRGLQGHHPVLRADRDPGVHEAGLASTPPSTT